MTAWTDEWEKFLHEEIHSGARLESSEVPLIGVLPARTERTERASEQRTKKPQ